ncbi:MAG: hypothetical protein ACKOTZ_11465 [Chloroflexota bacterium]
MADRSAGSPAYARHRLALLDQLASELHRVTHRNQQMQCLWLYDREVDLAGLERTYARRCAMPGNRLIEPSPLPFGRPRWVHGPRPGDPIRVGDGVLPRASLLAWANAHARLPSDPVAGPAWHVAVQRFDDGTSAVSITGSHLVMDGLGVVRSIEAAVLGTEVACDYLPRHGRGRRTAIADDLRQALADLPAGAAAGARATAMAIRGRLARPSDGLSRDDPAHHGEGTDADGERIVELPAVIVGVDAAAWDARARDLAGHPHGLMPALAARVAAGLGRLHRTDGSVSLVMPLDVRRGLDDDRALAFIFANVAIDPDAAQTSLRPVERAVLAGMRSAQRQPEMLGSLLPVVPWLPRRSATLLLDALFAYGDERPVTCSHVGTLPAAMGAIDGAPCRRLIGRGVDTNVTLRDLRRTHGHLVVVGSRFRDTVSIGIEGYEPSAGTTTGDLAAIARTALADLGLPGTIEA